MFNFVLGLFIGATFAVPVLAGFKWVGNEISTAWKNYQAKK